MEKDEFADFWEDGFYGEQDMADALFDKLDLTSTRSLYDTDWHDLFDDLNCRHETPCE